MVSILFSIKYVSRQYSHLDYKILLKNILIIPHMYTDMFTSLYNQPPLLHLPTAVLASVIAYGIPAC